MDFSELFTQGARDILPLARKKNLACCFDYSGSFIDVEQGHDQLRSATHRILLGMVDCLDSGFILLRATAEPAQNSSSLVVVHAAGTGVGSPAVIYGVLRRLQLDSRAGTNGERGDGITRAAGTCPATGGAVSFVNAGAEGAAMSVTIQVPAVDRPGNSRAPDAGRAAAWVVAPLAGGLELTDRRLRRLGWNVASFPSLRHAAALPVGGVAALPTLLIVAESTGSELAQLEEAAAATPALWPVLAVLAGSPTLRARGHTAVDIRVMPLSPLELERFTAHVDSRSSTAQSRETSPAPLYVQDSRLVLVMDDHEINRLVARSQLEALGYVVDVAIDGADALAMCRSHPPDLVLMDVDMPVMGGLEATERIRAWQQVGTLPPFPIVAATSGHSERRRDACLQSGMDGYLTKPVDLQALDDELHRLMPARPARGHDEPPRH